MSYLLQDLRHGSRVLAKAAAFTAIARVGPFDPAVLTIAVIVLSTAAMLACYVPGRRGARVVPLEALRSE